jgi:hypothetical protein
LARLRAHADIKLRWAKIDFAHRLLISCFLISHQTVNTMKLISHSAIAWFIAVNFVLQVPAAAQNTAAAPAASLTASKAAELTKNWMQTINSGQLDAWLALHADSVVYADHAWWQGKSREEMRSWGQAVIKAKGKFDITNSRGG